MPNAVNSRALTGKKPCINDDITCCWCTENKLSINSYRCYNVNPPSSLASHISIIVQLYYNKLVVCYPFLWRHFIFALLRHHVKAILFVHILCGQLRVKCKKEHSSRQSRTAGWQEMYEACSPWILLHINVGLSVFIVEFAYHLH